MKKILFGIFVTLTMSGELLGLEDWSVADLCDNILRYPSGDSSIRLAHKLRIPEASTEEFSQVSIFGSLNESTKMHVHKTLRTLVDNGDSLAVRILYFIVNNQQMDETLYQRTMADMQLIYPAELMKRKREIIEYNKQLDEDFLDTLTSLSGEHPTGVLDEDYRERVEQVRKTFYFTREIRKLEAVAVSLLCSSISFPVRKDMFQLDGSCCNVAFYNYQTGSCWIKPIWKTRQEIAGKPIDEGGGWKIHISATPRSATLMATITLPLLRELEASCKMVKDLQFLRALNKEYYEGKISPQRGKFITVYPMDDDHARQIATVIDGYIGNAIENKVFTAGDFIHCSGDFQIGHTGCIFTRWVHSFTRDVESDASRNIPVVNASVKTHPFDHLGLSYQGVELSGNLDEWPRMLHPNYGN